MLLRLTTKLTGAPALARPVKRRVSQPAARTSLQWNDRARRPKEGPPPRKPDEHDCKRLRIPAATSTVDTPERLVAVLDPDVVVRVDQAGAAPGAPREVRGARTWAKGALAFSRFAHFAQPALVNGAVGIVVAPRGRLFRVLHFTITRGKIAQVDVVADPTRLGQLNLAVLKD